MHVGKLKGIVKTDPTLVLDDPLSFPGSFLFKTNFTSSVFVWKRRRKEADYLVKMKRQLRETLSSEAAL